MEHRVQPVKRRQALQECNLPRNSWLQTHQDDETRGGAERGLAPNRKAEHRIDRFAHASKTRGRLAGCCCSAIGRAFSCDVQSLIEEITKLHAGSQSLLRR